MNKVIKLAIFTNIVVLMWQEEDPPQVLYLVSKSTLITHNTQLATNDVEFGNGIGIDSILKWKEN